ncbi:MAG TPA: glycosyltransferase family A protein [Chloroflexia bacterium]|nr:glycosyltransferase family A protein [Chloroflexia bacterium]
MQPPGASSPVSVVIPTHNRADLLRAAVDSVLAQTLPAREIVIADDGSTDHTRAVVSAFEAAGAPIVWLPAPPDGTPPGNRRSAARNRGVAAATAPWIAFLDSDDLWHPLRLERQLADLPRTPDAGFAFCNLQRFDGRGPFGGPYLAPHADYSGQILGELLAEALVLSSTLMVRRTALAAVGGWGSPRLGEDYELALRLAAAYPAGYLPAVLVGLREHPGRTTLAEQERPLLDHIGILQGFVATHPELPAAGRARARHAIANTHIKLARFYLDHGHPARARRHLRAVLWQRPWDRRLPAAYLRSWVPGRRE